MTTDLYPRHEKCLRRMRERIAACESILLENRENLLTFLTKLQADGTSSAQQLSHASRLFPIAKLIGNTDFKDVTRRQMESVFAAWRNGRHTGKPYKQASVNKTIECMKCFFRWVHGLSSQDPAPDSVRWLRREREVNDIRPEDLWTEEDVTKVLNGTRSGLYQTLISVAYESGLRPGELRGLKIGDVSFGDQVVRLYCRGKTRRKTGERVVPLIRSYDVLRKWVYNHPRKQDPEAWLWSFGSEPLPERNYSMTLQRLGRRAQLQKPTNPYILRHTALTRLYKEVPTPIARKLAGHVGNSEMVDVYCHLAMSDMEDSVRKMNGLPLRDKTQEKTTTCSRCHMLLDIGALECKHCGERFSTRSACELDEHEQNLVKLGRALLLKAEQDPKVIDLLLKERAQGAA